MILSRSRAPFLFVKVPPTLMSPPDSGMLMASPTLIFNIHGGIVPLDLAVCLRASPFGSRRPTIPTARTMTIARVASPLSTDRAYQPLFLHALKQYFNEEHRTQRILKHGDIISTNIDTNELRTLSSRAADNDTSDTELVAHRLVF
jgi:peroxin-6